MPRIIGSYTGDYLHMTNEELVEMFSGTDSQKAPLTLHGRVISDIKQVLLWRLKGDPRGWPAKTPKGV